MPSLVEYPSSSNILILPPLSFHRFCCFNGPFSLILALSQSARLLQFRFNSSRGGCRVELDKSGQSTPKQCLLHLAGMPQRPYNFQDPRFLHLPKEVPIPPEVTHPAKTQIIITPGLTSFGQFFKCDYLVGASNCQVLLHLPLTCKQTHRITYYGKPLSPEEWSQLSKEMPGPPSSPKARAKGTKKKANTVDHCESPGLCRWVSTDQFPPQERPLWV